MRSRAQTGGLEAFFMQPAVSIRLGTASTSHKRRCTHNSWRYSSACVVRRGAGAAASTRYFGTQLTPLTCRDLPRRGLSWKGFLAGIFTSSRKGKSSVSARHPTSARASFVPHRLPPQTEARSDFALWRHGVGMAQRGTAPELLFARPGRGDSCPDEAFCEPRGQRGSRAGESAS